MFPSANRRQNSRPRTNQRFATRKPDGGAALRQQTRDHGLICLSDTPESPDCADQIVGKIAREENRTTSTRSSLVFALSFSPSPASDLRLQQSGDAPAERGSADRMIFSHALSLSLLSHVLNEVPMAEDLLDLLFSYECKLHVANSNNKPPTSMFTASLDTMHPFYSVERTSPVASIVV